uniref:NADH dehydrogenase subunit 3 n=1 Tax=Orosius sp. TaxID=2974349 RepID=UPI0021820605|nr:NADH dehydrogenase subunit 3 [Orosius sp.]UVI59887.1 NADH dehydrogenase subunit 3 [Orosius sp.]
MYLMMLSMLTIILLLFFLSFLLVTISKKSIVDSQKSSPFECGFNPMSNSRLPFSIHFFIIAVIFLVFDIEIIMIMPMILTMKLSTIKYWLVTSISFTMILIIGLVHEWNNGMMNWTQ